jgi:hypothetical protein
MKLIAAIILVLTISEAQQQLENLTILEYNFLFQFGDLDTDQFNYLNYLWLGYIHRMENQQNTMNEFITGENNQGGKVIDVVCIVEWNGNIMSRYYIPTPEEFDEVMEIKKLFDKNKFIIEVSNPGMEDTQPITQITNLAALDEKFFLFPTIEEKEQKEKLINMVKAIRLKYKNDNFPYVEYEKFTEFIPTEKKAGKEGKGHDIGDVDSKRWYMFTQLIEIFQQMKFLNNKEYKWSVTSKTTGVLQREGKETSVSVNKAGTYVLGKSEILIKEKFYSKKTKKIQDGLEKASKAVGGYLTNESPKQAILFMYNKKRLQCEEPKTIAVWSNKDTAPDSQNFVVHVCTLIGTEKKTTVENIETIVLENKIIEENNEQTYKKNDLPETSEELKKIAFICTHFKSKADGFESRMNLGNEIRLYIETKLTGINVVLMGDLNSEISEVATAIGGKISRTKVGEKGTDNKVYYPNETLDQIAGKSTLEKSDDTEKVLNLKEDIFKEKEKYMLHEFLKSEIDTTIKSLESLEEKLEKLEEEIATKDVNKIFENSSSWIETSSEYTESKIRIKEIDYFNPKFLKLVQNLKGNKEESQNKCFFDHFVKKINPKIEEPKSEEPKIEEPKIEEPKSEELKSEELKNKEPKSKETEKVDLKDKIKAHNTLIKGAFLNWVDCLREIINFSSIKDQEGTDKKLKFLTLDELKAANLEIAKSQLSEILESLTEKEKIDYILVRPVNEVTVTEIRKLANEPELLKFGTPNKTFSSDHLPTCVTIEINFGKPFVSPEIKALI